MLTDRFILNATGEVVQATAIEYIRARYEGRALKACESQYHDPAAPLCPFDEVATPITTVEEMSKGIFRYACDACSAKQRAAGERAPRKPGPLAITTPPVYELAKPADFTPKDRAELLKWPRKEPFMLLAGINGSGKTHAVWMQALLAARNGIRLTILSPVADWRARWIGADLRREQHEKAIYDAAFLVLDDLTGAGASGPGWGAAWSDLMHRLLEHRVSYRLPTLVTLHSTLSQVEQLYSAAVRSRLSSFYPHTLPAVDRRKEPTRGWHRPSVRTAPSVDNRR